jgi:hypothetical protein
VHFVVGTGKVGKRLCDVDATRLRAAESVPAMEQDLKWENFTLPNRLPIR